MSILAVGIEGLSEFAKYRKCHNNIGIHLKSEKRSFNFGGKINLDSNI